MSNNVCFLITLTDGNRIMKVALKVNRDKLKGDCEEYPMEDENKLQLYNMLPVHASSFGKIVNIEEIFEVVINQ